MDPERPSALAHVLRERRPWQPWHKWPPSTINAVEDLFVGRLEARNVEVGAAYLATGQWKFLIGSLVVATDPQKHIVDLLPDVKRQQELKEWVHHIDLALDLRFVKQVKTLLGSSTQDLDREHILQALRDICCSYRLDARRIALERENGSIAGLKEQQNNRAKRYLNPPRSTTANHCSEDETNPSWDIERRRAQVPGLLPIRTRSPVSFRQFVRPARILHHVDENMRSVPAPRPGGSRAVTSIYTFCPSPGHTAFSQAVPNPLVSCPKSVTPDSASRIAIQKRMEVRLHDERGKIDKLRRKKRKLQMRRENLTLEQQLLEARAEIVYLNTAIEGLESES